MHISLSVWDMTAPDLVDLGMAAEACGFEGLWVGEHVLAPVGHGSAHPTSGGSAHQHHADAPIISLDTELTDPLVALAGVATRTTRLRLATGVFVLPLRHPLAVARAAMTLQDLAGGRFRLGVGAGWLAEEFEALDRPFSARGARLEECLEILALATAGGPFSYSGVHHQVGEVQLTPRPVPVPVVFGGSSPRALRRAGQLADGWFASGTPDVEEVSEHRSEILRHREAAGITAPMHFAVRCPEPDPALIERYRRAGFDEVVLWADQLWAGDDRPARDEQLRHHASRLGLDVITS